MKKFLILRKLTVTSTLFMVAGFVIFPSLVSAIATNTTSSDSSGSTLSSSEQQQHLANIKSRGDAEINRRLTQLNKLGDIIASATHLTASDKSSLNSEVNAEIGGLTALETQLNNETTLAAAINDAKSIISEYRVYALVTPKVWLIKTADDQQSVEAKLATLATKLQSRITADQNAGKNVSSLQNNMTALNTQINNAEAISSSVETAVLPLQPSDYDTDTSILSGYNTQLKTAHNDVVTAYNDAKAIVSSLKSLDS